MTQVGQPCRIEAIYAPAELQTAAPPRRAVAAILDSAFLAIAAGSPPAIGYAVLEFFGEEFFGAAANSPDEAGDIFLVAALGLLVAALLLVPAWCIWFGLAVHAGQSPAKQLLGLYVMREDGSRGGGWYTASRELLIKGGLIGGAAAGLPVALLTGGATLVYMEVGNSDFPDALRAAAAATTSWRMAPLCLAASCIGILLGWLWCLGGARQALWDQAAHSYIAYSPLGFRPETATEARAGLPARDPVPAGERGNGGPTALARLEALQRLREDGSIGSDEHTLRRRAILAARHHS